MRILAIDTSCDETAAAVTENAIILSNIIWSQAAQHTKFGGVMPSLAQRMHEERIDWVIKRSLATSRLSLEKDINAIAVTAGPGLAIALGVGIAKAKELAIKYNKALIAVNHLEGHILSPFARPKESSNFQFPISNELQNNNSELKIKNLPFTFPVLGLVISGGNTLLVEIEEIGRYKTLAATTDDALGEALDKAARMLGLGYPGGAILENFAREGNPNVYKLPVPIVGQEERKIFTYSGLKTAMYRLVESLKVNGKSITKKQTNDLAASFQEVAFKHLIRVIKYIIGQWKMENGKSDLLVGGGVAANIELRKRLRKLGSEFNINVHFPYTKKLTGDNAAMIGIAAFYKFQRNQDLNEIDSVDREANTKIDSPFKWQTGN